MKRKAARTDYVWVTEMTDPSFHWDNVLPVIQSGEPVVIYSKAPIAKKKIKQIKNLPNFSIGITITGWGGKWLEPGVQKPNMVVDFFNWLVDEIGGKRVRLRIDPVVPTEEGYNLATSVAAKIKKNVDVITSLIQMYKDQEKVFTKLGVDLGIYTIKSGRAIFPNPKTAHYWLQRLHDANPNFVGRVHFCGMPYDIQGAIHSGCVDEKLLKSIGISDFKKITPGKQRPGCRCVISKKQLLSGACQHRCLYCYAHKENLKTEII